MSSAHPTSSEKFRFDNDGYLVLENFLDAAHVHALILAGERAIAKRTALLADGLPGVGETQLSNQDARLFYILDDDPLFLEMLDWPAMWPYVTGLLNARPHHHASDLIVEYPNSARGMGWHIDGHDEGYRSLGWPIPLLQLKIGYYLTEMTEPGRGNLCVIPGSHRARLVPDPEDRKRIDLFPGAIQVCAPAGSAVLFHNALWHSGGPWTKTDGSRIMLYYAYEHPWMMASAEHWNYPAEFYNGLSPERRKLFHGFVFHPPEQRWG